MLGHCDESNPVLSLPIAAIASLWVRHARLTIDEFSTCRCAGQASDRRTGACGKVQVLDEYDILDTKNLCGSAWRSRETSCHGSSRREDNFLR